MKSKMYPRLKKTIENCNFSGRSGANHWGCQSNLDWILKSLLTGSVSKTNYFNYQWSIIQGLCYNEPMFRRANISKSFIAFLLPLTFVWSWAACSLLCSEITERLEKQSVLAVYQNSENCLDATFTDDCPYSATAAVIEARPHLTAPSLEIVNINSFSAPELTYIPVSVYRSDRHQNSPPRNSSDPPLFLKICTFRI